MKDIAADSSPAGTPVNQVWTVGMRLWVERGGQVALNESGAELLAAVERLRSISAAAKAIGISYRTAWNLVQEMNQAAADPLVISAVGGMHGGGAVLTPHGIEALQLYRELAEAMRGAAHGILQRTLLRDRHVHLSAAISLQEVVGHLLADYMQCAPETRVRTIFGASNELADQLLAGSPGDLFISADGAHLDRLQAAGLLDPSSRRIVAENRLTIVAASGAAKLKDISRADCIAVAEPECPLGKYTQEYLRRAQLESTLATRLLHVDNSRAVMNAITAGIADAGIVFRSDAMRGECRVLEQLDVKAAYHAAVVTRGNQRQAAESLSAFLTSRRAQKQFRQFGLTTPKHLAS